MTEQAFRRVAIVNRGEPAMRLINAVREWNAQGLVPLRTIAIHTAVDRYAMFVREADEAVLLGPDDPDYLGPSPYLDYAELERALTVARAEAVWPGWGFVSEKADFARLCRNMGIVFIGPSPEVMERLGDKIASKLLAEEVGVPMAAWSGGPVADVAAAREQAERIGYPLMVKATAGGGGRGIRKVVRAEDLDEAFERASSEAAKTAGDATVFMERAISGGRHVEVQVVADASGDVWTLGVRDCSVQRRNQKVIEESASTALDAEQEQQLRTSAAALVKAAGYVNAGTVEFLYEPAERLLSFLEVNTRLQVEHPVTEATTGADIVKLQLHIAGGGVLKDIAPESPAGQGARDRGPAHRRGPGGELRARPRPHRAPRAALRTRHPRRHGRRGGGRHPAPVRLHDRQGDRVGPRPRRGPRPAVARAAPDRRGDRRRHHEQGLPARPARPARGAERRAGHDLARHDDGRRLHAAAAHRRRTAGRGRRGAGRARRPAARAAVRLGGARPPEVGHETWHQVDVRVGGESYRLRVAQSRRTRYHVELDGKAVDVEAERTGRFERKLTVGDTTFAVLSVPQGSDYLVEVDGAVHRISGGEAGHGPRACARHGRRDPGVAGRRGGGG